MRRTRAKAAALALASACLVAAPAFADTLQEIEINGPSDNRIDLQFLGDGYTAAEQEKFLEDVDGMIEAIFSEAPFGQYRPFFNFYAISTISAESGADHPEDGTTADTAFGCAYNCFEIERLICCDDAAVFATADALLPGHDAMVLIVNDAEYGGSGGYYAISSVNSWSGEIVTHEFGHSLAMLGDEYEDPYPGFVFQDVFPNVSPTAIREELKWATFVAGETPLPTPESAATSMLEPVGAYEGACYQSTGLYRPVSECFMRNIESGFCAVCSQALVLSYYGFVEIIDSSAPEGDAASGAAGETIDFSVDAVEADPGTAEIAWSLDGVEVAFGDAFALPISCLTQGAHDVTVAVEDTTDLVLEDPESLMIGSRSWTVTRTDDGVVDDCFPEAADGGSDSDADGGSEPDAGDGAGSGDGCGCRAAGAAVDPRALLVALL